MLKRVAIFLFALITVACGKKTEPGVYSKMDLVGTWKNTCENSLLAGTSTQDTYIIHDSSVSRRFTYFSGSDCKTEDVSLVYNYGYSDAKFVSPDIKGWTTVSQNLMFAVAELKSDYFLKSFNRNSRFGYNDWAVDQPKDISGKKFDASSDAKPKVYDRRVWTLVKEENFLMFADYENGMALRNEDEDHKFSRVP